MDLPDRHMLLGMTLGAICATALAAIGPGAVIDVFADEFTTPAFDTSGLVKFEGRDYEISSEDWVSADVQSTAVVKKVEAGKVTYVTISTTPTGTYSTDALFSNHVQYPGISVTEQQGWPHLSNSVRYWSHGNWYSLFVRSGNSVVYLSGKR